MNFGTWILAIIAAVILYGIWVYNRLIKERNTIDEAWSGIDVQLKRRHNLIPNLVATVKGYAKHESEVLEKLTQQRTGSGVGPRGAQESDVSKALMNLFAVAENYPELKASQNFMDLQKDLNEIEQHIQLARRYYNGAVRDYNTRIESFPSNIVAGYFKFTQREFFEIEDIAQRALPEVKF